MFIHVFGFRWRDGVTEETKERVASSIRSLQGRIPGLVETWVGANTSPRGQGCALGGVMQFTDRTAFASYGSHPAHQELLSWLMPLIDPVEIDFEASK